MCKCTIWQWGGVELKHKELQKFLVERRRSPNSIQYFSNSFWTWWITMPMLCTPYNFTIWGRTLKHSEAVHTSEMYIYVYKPTYRHIPEDVNLHRISNLINHLAFRWDLTKYLLLNKQQAQSTTGVGRSITNPPSAWLLSRNFVQKIPRRKKKASPREFAACKMWHGFLLPDSNALTPALRSSYKTGILEVWTLGRNEESYKYVNWGVQYFSWKFHKCIWEHKM
jgi:hypothetical protein